MRKLELKEKAFDLAPVTLARLIELHDAGNMLLEAALAKNESGTLSVRLGGDHDQLAEAAWIMGSDFVFRENAPRRFEFVTDLSHAFKDDEYLAHLLGSSLVNHVIVSTAEFRDFHISNEIDVCFSLINQYFSQHDTRCNRGRGFTAIQVPLRVAWHDLQEEFFAASPQMSAKIEAQKANLMIADRLRGQAEFSRLAADEAIKMR